MDFLGHRNKMSTFLIDIKALDDRFRGSPLYIEIEAEGIGFIDANLPKYNIFQKADTSITQILLAGKSLDLNPRQEEMFGYPLLVYAKAALFFLPTNDGFASIPKAKRDRMQVYEVLHAYGKFFKGDAEKFKEYGILLKGEK